MMVSQKDFVRYRTTPTPEMRVKELEGLLKFYRGMSDADKRDKDALKGFITSCLPQLTDDQRRQALELFKL
jgi:hypothetical protein